MSVFNLKSPFGTTTATTTASGSMFGFGSGTAPLFGAATTTASTGFGFGFGTSSAAPTFGTTTTSSAPSFGAQASGFSFGSTAAAPSFGSTTSASTGFGFGGAVTSCASQAFNFGGLGQNTISASSTGTTTSTGFGGFPAFNTGLGNTTGTGTGFGAASAAGQVPQNAFVQTANIYSAVSMPLLFGDERDAVIAKWNQLQAFWGTGRGYFNQQGQFVDFTPDNPFSFFKAVGYNCLPSVRNEEGLVALTFDRRMPEVCDNQQSIVDSLQRFAVAALQRINPTSQLQLSICVDGVRPLIDEKTEMIIYAQQRANTGVTSRISATDLFSLMNNLKTELQTQLSISGIVARTGMTPEQKKLYLDNAPAGIDARIWEQAKLDNPDPDHMLPVPMVGFAELHNRLKHQEQQTNLHQARLDLLAADIAKLQHNQADAAAKTEQYKRNLVTLSHRLLKVLVKQEVYRKHGYSIMADDEQLRVKLETIYAELNAPLQFKGRLNELMSQMRMQNQLGSSARPEAGYQIDPAVQQEIKKHLKRQQEGLSHLISIIKDDLEELAVIERGLADNGKQKR